MNDFLYQSANARRTIINTAQQRLMSDVAEAQAYGNTTEAGEILQQIANLEAEKKNLDQLQADYNKTLPKQPRPDAWREKRTDEMTHLDMFNMINATSEHKLTPEDYNAGLRKLQEEKANGNYTGKP